MISFRCSDTSTSRDDCRILQVAGSAQFDGARRLVWKLELEERVRFGSVF